jgi:nitrite reductase/ring-hydroxylating ferredoxin subunit
MGSAPLPLDWYTDPDAFAQERRTLFAREWQMIGRADQLASPGAYVCANLAGWPVFALRDEAGGLGAFRNACRHQNLPVLDNGAGTAKLLRCRYHGWTYDFTGAFLSAPPMVAPQDPAASDHHLQTFGVAAWRGLVFIAPDPAAESPAAVLDALLGEDRTALDQFRGEFVTDLNCNWKIIVERYLSSGDGLRWRFPCLAFETLPGGLLVHQIVPRTHLRSRIVHHLYGAGAAEAARRAAADLKIFCEAAQTSCQAGTPSAETASSPALAEFRERLRAVHTETSG